MNLTRRAEGTVAGPIQTVEMTTTMNASPRVREQDVNEVRKPAVNSQFHPAASTSWFLPLARG